MDCNCTPLFWPYQTMKPPSVSKDTKNPTSNKHFPHPTFTCCTQPSQAGAADVLCLALSNTRMWIALCLDVLGQTLRPAERLMYVSQWRQRFWAIKLVQTNAIWWVSQTPVYYSNFSSIFPVWNPRPKQQLAHHWIKASVEMPENPLTLDL